MGIASTDFPIVGSYNNQRISEIDSERSVNCFEYRDPLGKKSKSLIGSSGLINLFLNFSAATLGFRAQFVFQNFQYVVIGRFIFSISMSNVVSLLYNNLNTTTGYVGIDANTFQVGFVDGADGYVWDTIAMRFTQITDTSFPANPIDITMLDNFAIVANGNTPNFQMSMLDQMMVWGPASNSFTTAFATNSQLTVSGGTANYQTGVPVTLSTTGALPAPLNSSTTYYTIFIDSSHIELATSLANAQAGTFITLTSDGSGTQTITSLGQLQQGAISSHPGNIVACRTLHRRLFLFSAFFTEVWENSGIGTNLPVRRSNSLLIEYGTPCLGSIAISFDRMLFLSQTRDGVGPVVEVIGAQAVSVSNRALNSQLAIYSSLQQLADCRAFMIQENGIIFYRMNFTAANHTFVYNVSLSNPAGEEGDLLWHEEQDLHGNRHWAQTHAYFNGINYVGSYQRPVIFQVAANVYSNAGESIHRIRISRPIYNEGSNRRRVDRLFLDMLQGNVALLDETNPPFVFLSISKDGGQSYGLQLKLPFGAIGQRTFRTLARKLGVIPRGQAFVCKIEFFSQVPFVLLGASWVTEILPE
jgi:hypothetical protein